MQRRPEVVGFRVSVDERKRLENEAERRDVPVSYVVRQALAEIIREREPQNAA